MLEPVADAGRGAGLDVGVEHEAHGGVADRVRRDLEAGVGEALDRAASRSGSGQNGSQALAVRVGLLEPGRAAVDHAVGEELHDAAAPQPPAHVAQRQLRLHLLVGRLRRHPQRDPQAHRQLVRALEVAQQVVGRRLAVHHVRAGEAERVEPLQLGHVAGAQLRPAQLRRGAQDEVLRAHLAQLAGRRSVLVADDLGVVREVARAVDLRQLERARRGERGVQVGEPHERGGAVDRGGDLGDRRRGVVVQPPGEQPAAVDGARGQRREHLLLRSCSGSDRRRGPAPRPRTGAGGSRSSPGISACPPACRTSVRASQCARTSASPPTATIVPWRTATAVANGRAGSSVRIRAPTIARSAGIRAVATSVTPVASDADLATQRTRATRAEGGGHDSTSWWDGGSRRARLR